ncbi:uncharacterized protein LOC105803099 isoform X3 [Gossypium raimondii]|uniref:uncharacterized protein LOC105803099 isoform X3 n=1 Tax=Gossypium raimondii TaxID=29730 RepID=UPI00063A957C|nr:uncharacterized protein LOC105803099 isoform X3 [Gossypium raimondii]
MPCFTLSFSQAESHLQNSPSQHQTEAANKVTSTASFSLSFDCFVDQKQTCVHQASFHSFHRFSHVSLLEFEPKERYMLLKFVTSCSRAPLLGFKYLQPAFTIHKVASDAPLWAAIGGSDVEQLPSASTCYNTLKAL